MWITSEFRMGMRRTHGNENEKHNDENSLILKSLQNVFRRNDPLSAGKCGRDELPTQDLAVAARSSLATAIYRVCPPIFTE
jgi:hypothetical protein